MTVLNTTSPVAAPPGGSCPISSPSNAVPSARTSSPSCTVMSAGPACSCTLVHSRTGPSPLGLGVHHHRLAGQHRVPHPAAQLHARVGGVAAAARQPVGVDR